MNYQRTRLFVTSIILVALLSLLAHSMLAALNLNSFSIQIGHQALIARRQQPLGWPLHISKKGCTPTFFSSIDGSELSPRPVYLLAMLFLACGDTDSAVGYFQDLLMTKPDDADTKVLLAVSILASGREEEARRLLHDRPLTALLLFVRLSDEAVREQNPTQAAHWLDSAGEFVSESYEPIYLQAYYYLACNTYRDVGRLEEALTACNALVEQSPDIAIHWLLLGRAYLATQNYPQAGIHVQRAIDLEPDNGAFYYYLGLSYEGQHQQVAAWDVYMHSIRLAPTYGWVRLRVAALEIMRGNVKQAIDHLKVALASGDAAVQRQAEIELSNLLAQEH